MFPIFVVWCCRPLSHTLLFFPLGFNFWIWVILCFPLCIIPIIFPIVINQCILTLYVYLVIFIYQVYSFQCVASIIKHSIFTKGWMTNFSMSMFLLLILSTSLWSFSELWGGGVSTSDIELFGPRICRLFLLTLNNPPWPLILTSYILYPLSSSLSCLRTGSSAHPGVTRLRPSIPR